ncbi:type 1 fimbrial protein [Pseudomonas sp. BIGb0427]|uniref:fimbrial protein n=1 Tax=Pseudomonas sp. BIGb0427 TaxID=2724470 RepID=UPI0018A7B3B1|nr:fimbrial protein [Pseudomonas sp. BIGb0427]QPG61861.1 type 1 fimbrial protein [Pseudomonas sp. BIGb0427]
MRTWAMTTVACLAAACWLPASFADEDNMYFRGTLAEEPCTLAVEDQAIELDFSSVSDKDLYLNRRTLARPIVLHLQSCDMSLGKRLVSITFSGTESTELPGLLVLQGDTQGVAIGLETARGTALALNQLQPLAELASGDNLIGFSAYLQGEPEALANRTIGLGALEASLTFALSYD